MLLLQFYFKGTKMDETMKFILNNALTMNLTEFKFLSAMHYSDRVINIYECAHTTPNSEGRKYNSNYYFEPNCYLDHESASCHYNKVTQEHEMNFTITFWDDHLLSLVMQHLRRFCDHKIKFGQVHVIPLFTKVMLSVKQNTFYGHYLPMHWIYYQQCQQFIKFKLICDSEPTAKNLAKHMRQHPQEFSDLLVVFGIEAQTVRKVETVINIENIVSGNLSTKLLQTFPEAEEVYLKADDANELLTESATRVMIQTFSNQVDGIISPQKDIFDLLKNLLITSNEVIMSENDQRWKLVFWNEENYRPDKVTKMLNASRLKNTEETKKTKDNNFEKTNKTDIKAEMEVAPLQLVKGKGEFATDRSFKTDQKEFACNKLLIDSEKHVMLEGEKYVPKPLTVSKINLAKLKDKKTLTDRRINVHQYGAGFLTCNVTSLYHRQSMVELTSDEGSSEIGTR